MTPSDNVLLDLIRRTVRVVGYGVTDNHLLATFDGIDIVLNELLSRQRPEFYLAHYETGVALVARGEELFAATGQDAADVETGALPARIDGDARFVAWGREIDTVAQRLSRLVRTLGHETGVAAADHVGFLDAVVDWEVSLYRHREQHVEGVASREIAPPAITADRLAAYLSARFPAWTGLRIESFVPVVGGFSKGTVLFETHDEVHGRQRFAARIAPLHNFLNFDGYDVAREYSLLRYLHAQGLPVAEPVFVETDAAALGLRFFVSRMVPGRPIGTIKESEPLSEDLVRRIAQALARIHTMPLDAADAALANSHIPRWLTGGLADSTAAYIGEWRAETARAKIDPSPAVERGLCWLESNVPQTEGEAVLVHGDFGLNNMLVVDGEISAVLDWEVSRAGDPAEDMTNFFSGSGGVVDRELFMAAYVEAGGRSIDTFRMHYFDVYHIVKIMICGLAAFSQIEQWTSTRVSHASFAFRYMTFFAARLNGAIALAEAAKNRGGA